MNIITTEHDTADSQERFNNGHRPDGIPRHALGRFVNPGNRRIIYSGGPDSTLRWASTAYGQQPPSVVRLVDFLVARTLRLLALRKMDSPALPALLVVQVDRKLLAKRRSLLGTPALQADRSRRRLVRVAARQAQTAGAT